MKTPKNEQPHIDAEIGDEVYFRHSSGPKCGFVRNRGKHGCVIEADGSKHKVTWDRYLGHKARVRHDAKVVDQGDDGIVVEHGDGQRRYIHDPLQPMAKSLMPSVLFFTEEETLVKAQTIKNRPGLALKDITDSRGRQSKHWVRTGKPEPEERKRAASEPDGGDRAGKPYLAGSKVSFKIGSLTGKGKIVGNPGKAGAYVEDDTGHKHKVRWADMGDVVGDKDGAQATPDKAPEGTEAPARAAGLFSQDTASLPSRVAQPVSDWESLKEKGEEGLGQFKAALGKVADKLGLRTDVGVDDLKGDHVTSKDGFLFIGPLKGEARAKQKVEAEYGGDWSQVRDMVRATIAVSSMDEVRAAVKAVEDSGLELAQKPKDKFTNPTAEGYRDLNTIVKLPNGMLAELQYHLKPITEAKNVAHKDYEESRTLSAKYGEDSPSSKWSDEDHARFHQAVKRQKDTYGAAWKKAGGEQISA